MTELARYAGSRTGAGYHPVPSQSAREVQRASSGIAPLGQHEIGALVQRALQDFSLEDPDATVRDCTARLQAHELMPSDGFEVDRSLGTVVMIEPPRPPFEQTATFLDFTGIPAEYVDLIKARQVTQVFSDEHHSQMVRHNFTQVGVSFVPPQSNEFLPQPLPIEQTASVAALPVPASVPPRLIHVRDESKALGISHAHYVVNSFEREVVQDGHAYDAIHKWDKAAFKAAQEKHGKDYKMNKSELAKVTLTYGYIKQLDSDPVSNKTCYTQLRESALELNWTNIKAACVRKFGAIPETKTHHEFACQLARLYPAQPH